MPFTRNAQEQLQAKAAAQAFNNIAETANRAAVALKAMSEEVKKLQELVSAMNRERARGVE